MEKIGRPKRLIGYDNDINIKRRMEGKKEIYRLVRPRTVIYCGMITVVGAIMLYALLTRSLLDVNVLHDRNPVAVKLADGSIRNAYTMRLLNKRASTASSPSTSTVPSMPPFTWSAVDSVTQDRPMIVLGRDQTTELRVLVTAPAEGNPGEIGAGALQDHRYRSRRNRGCDRQFCVALNGQESPMSNPSRAPRPLTGKMVLFYLVAFFATVIGVNMVMMKLAIDTLPGTEVDSAYRASLAYEREIVAAQDQDRRKWKVVPMSNAAPMAPPRCGSMHAMPAARRCRTEILRPAGAADRQANRSCGRTRRKRHRHLSRQHRRRAAGTMGSRHRRRGEGRRAAVPVAQPHHSELTV